MVILDATKDVQHERGRMRQVALDKWCHPITITITITFTRYYYYYYEFYYINDYLIAIIVTINITTAIIHRATRRTPTPSSARAGGLEGTKGVSAMG